MRYSSLASYILSTTPPSKADLSSNNVLIARLTQGQTDHCSDRKIFIFVSRKKIKNFLSGALQSRLGGVNPVPAGTQKKRDRLNVYLSFSRSRCVCSRVQCWTAYAVGRDPKYREGFVGRNFAPRNRCKSQRNNQSSAVAVSG